MPKPLKTIPFTTQKYKQMQQKVLELEAEREVVMARLIEARGMGDLSENGAYQYAKFELGNIGRQLKRFKTLVQQGFAAPKNTGRKGAIDFGSFVVVQKTDASKQKLEFTIVSKHESDLTQGKLAYTSPMGQALMRKKEGDVVLVQTPTKKIEYVVVKVA